MPVRVFSSYARADESFMKDIDTQLALLEEQGVIAAWHDRDIGAGAEFAAEIDAQVDSANIILLLVSANFLASDYCYKKEMARAMERHEAGEAIVIPVILRACEWRHAPFAKLNATPRDGVPIVEHAHPDQALLAVATAVREAAERAKKRLDGRGPGRGTATGVTLDRRLSAAARELLVAASHTEYRELHYSTTGRPSLRVGGRPFIQPNDPASARKWSRAVEELQTARCVEEDHQNEITKDLVLKVTDLGLDTVTLIEDE